MSDVDDHPPILRVVTASDGTRIALRAESLNDDDMVLIHMGAGAVESAAKAALLNFDSYRGLESAGGLLCVSVFGLTHGVTKMDILAVMRHGQYGQARYGDIKHIARVIPTTIINDETTHEMAALQAAHYDLVIDVPSQSLAKDCPIDNLDQTQRDLIHDEVCEVLRLLLARFEPRLSRKDSS